MQMVQMQALTQEYRKEIFELQIQMSHLISSTRRNLQSSAGTRTDACYLATSSQPARMARVRGKGEPTEPIAKQILSWNQHTPTPSERRHRTDG